MPHDEHVNCLVVWNFWPIGNVLNKDATTILNLVSSKIKKTIVMQNAKFWISLIKFFEV